MEVGLGPGHIVLDGDLAPLPIKGAQPPIFGPFLLWPNCWMHQEKLNVFFTFIPSRKMPLGMKVDLDPGHIVLDGDQLPLPQKGGTAPPIFGPPISIVAKLLDASRCHLVYRQA